MNSLAMSVFSDIRYWCVFSHRARCSSPAASPDEQHFQRFLIDPLSTCWTVMISQLQAFSTFSRHSNAFPMHWRNLRTVVLLVWCSFALVICSRTIVLGPTPSTTKEPSTRGKFGMRGL
ncbi:hypothetical protein, unlikely [Trypanosoma congolense IL3000]|uniref:Uncharacterized protein n=1 Tax=Trypanosoma congolense (strain IL3000) TaxID=1068625 RepID=F9WAJ4_TRYCI|nr:hypothetical protein, unlikely [Trypanosoma congolense IL3000]